MVRWEPNARGRLEQAALELYLERGFEQTTVAEIAKRAGLTERTFFRYFADKREVLFGGSGELQELLAQKVAEAPASLRPSTRSPKASTRSRASSGCAASSRSSARPSSPRTPELQERELIKLASLAAATAEALRRRGVTGPGREPHRGGRDRRLQNRVRALGRPTPSRTSPS